MARAKKNNLEFAMLPFNRMRALIYASFVFRNAASVEDNYTNLVKLDDKIYQKVLLEVSSRFEKYKFFYLWDEGVHDEDASVIRNWLFMHVKDWDPPQKTKERYRSRKMTPVEFVLNGTFKKNCDSFSVMDDCCMNAINHDVYNRFYTLCSRNII